MRETKFIAEKQHEWRELEQVLDESHPDPDRLGELFIQATDDLSFARTFYPNRSVRVYLNGLAQRLFLLISPKKQLSGAAIRLFFTEELPDLMWHARRTFAWVSLAFVLLFVVGWVSSAYSPDFDKTILGEEYISMTKENIAKGNPMGVYQGDAPLPMFFRIALNNIKVDCLTFVMGIFAGIGALMIMLYNAVMVGSFQHFFWANGGFTTSLFSIWVHGAFEISAMILSTVAGIELGKGLLFPGTYTRLQAFQMSAQRGIKIFVSVILITILAAFNESFITRFSDASYILRGSIIFTSFSFVFIYFAYFPYKRFQAGLVQPINDAELPSDSISKIEWSGIKTIGDIIKDVFALISAYFSPIMAFSTAISALYALSLYAFVGGTLKGIITFNNALYGVLLQLHLSNFLQFLEYGRLPIFFFIANTLAFSAINLLGNFWLMQHYTGNKMRVATFLKQYRVANLTALFLAVFLHGLLYFYGKLGMFFIFFPTIQMLQFIQYTQQPNPFRALNSTLRLFNGGFIQILNLYAVFLIFSFILSILSSSQIMMYLLDFIQWNLVLTKADGYVLIRYFLSFITIFNYCLLTILFKFGFSRLAASLYEQTDAPNLLHEIEHIGTHTQLRGIAQE